MSESQAPLEGLKAVWDVCKAEHDQKHSLITDLFAYIEDLGDKLSEAESELRDKKDVIKLNRDRIEKAEKRVDGLQFEKNRLLMALVLIDGDCTPFKDELVKQGIDGGQTAASLLKQAVEEELRSSTPAAAPHIQVIVRIYANMKGLAKTYKEMGILSDLTCLDQFVRGFNMGDALSDFVDAGNGKECSDHKIHATFKHYLLDMHCQQVLFGGIADGGYARLLGPFAEDKTIRDRITLLQGPPCARELAGIKDKFHAVSFDKVLRDQKLVNPKRRVSFHLTPPATPSPDYATAAARAPSTPEPASGIQSVATGPGRPVTGELLRNRRGQRVDSTLSYSQQDFFKLKKSKLCNHFYLLGTCSFQEQYGDCQHGHGQTLNSRQLIALRAVARQSACPAKLDCDDPDCICGHRCTRDNCLRKDCRFPPEMHNVDTNVVSVI